MPIALSSVPKGIPEILCPGLYSFPFKFWVLIILADLSITQITSLPPVLTNAPRL
jgi:hypothetical protein